MSNDALTWAFNLDGVKSGPKFVLVALADYADEANSCYPGVKKIARRTGISESSVRVHLDTLIELQLITEERRHGAGGYRTSNRYHVNVGGVIDLTPDSDASDSPSAESHDDLAPDSDPPSAEIRRTVVNPQSVNPQIEPPVKTRARERLESFDEFWALYPRHAAKAAALTAFNRAIARTTVENIIESATRYRDDPNRDPAFTAHASTWLNRDSWDDDPLPPRTGNPARPRSNIDGFAQLYADVEAAQRGGSEPRKGITR